MKTFLRKFFNCVLRSKIPVNWNLLLAFITEVPFETYDKGYIRRVYQL